MAIFQLLKANRDDISDLFGDSAQDFLRIVMRANPSVNANDLIFLTNILYGNNKEFITKFSHGSDEILNFSKEFRRGMMQMRLHGLGDIDIETSQIIFLCKLSHLLITDAKSASEVTSVVQSPDHPVQLSILANDFRESLNLFLSQRLTDNSSDIVKITAAFGYPVAQGMNLDEIIEGVRSRATWLPARLEVAVQTEVERSLKMVSEKEKMISSSTKPINVTHDADKVPASSIVISPVAQELRKRSGAGHAAGQG